MSNADTSSKNKIFLENKFFFLSKMMYWYFNFIDISKTCPTRTLNTNQMVSLSKRNNQSES